MASEEQIREIAERVCAEALRERAHELAAEVGERVSAAIASQPGAQSSVETSSQAQNPSTVPLRDGVTMIAETRSQVDTMEALLAAAAVIAPACGVLIVRGAQATGWSCQELCAADTFRRAIMDCSKGDAAIVVNSCRPAALTATDLDPIFLSITGLTRWSKVMLLPVVLKERTAALLLAVGEGEERMAALEVLVQTAQLALELQSARKAQPEPTAAPATAPVETTPVASPAPVYSAPRPVAPAGASAEAAPGARSVVAVRESVAARVAAVPQWSAAPAAAAEDAEHSPEAHEKARRFAKLLVEEIQLYNQAKVREGRANRDLYIRLHDDIEKSRAAYEKRYGEKVSGVDYFTQELLRILADNNPAVMGAGFPG